MLRFLAITALLTSAEPMVAAEIRVSPGEGVLQEAIAGAEPGDTLFLEPGRYPGSIILDRSLTLTGTIDAIIDGLGQGTVITVAASDVTVSTLSVTGSGMDSKNLDAGIKILKRSDRTQILDNRIIGNLHGIDVHGGHDSVVRGNTIEGTQQPRLNDRGNGIYVWNSPGTVVEANSVRWGRDGIFSNASRKGYYRNNLFRDLRFAVHYMYTNDSEVVGNVSIGNHLGFAIMFSNRITVANNLSLSDRNYGLMLNYANNAEVSGNLVRGGAEKCTFIYNAHKNLIFDNRFEGCGIGIHFTAGSERNVFTGNAFIGNRNQVKYVGTKDIEWSFEGRGNYWSDHPAFDLNGDAIADNPFRPNDLMDHILWSQPAAHLLTGSPAVQLVRWSQSNFPSTLPGGVTDDAPLMAPIEISVAPRFAALEMPAQNNRTLDGTNDIDIDDLSSH